jgi:hypothetical protein
LPVSALYVRSNARRKLTKVPGNGRVLHDA